MTGDERYRLMECLGRGGMAEVYRAYDEVAEMEVAVKILHEYLTGDEAVVEAFRREATMMQGLDHRAILQVYSSTVVKGRPAIVMEYLPGGDVYRLLKLEGKLSEERAREIGLTILDALAHAHSRGVIHRDIKPHNFLLDEEGQPVLIDFGIGQQEEAIEGGSQAQLGTVEYMAPERLDGLAIDGRSDLYSLGISLFEMVVGHLPYRAESPAAVMRMHRDEIRADPKLFQESLSENFRQVVMQALSTHPEERFDRAEEMAAALSGEARLPRKMEPHARWQRLREDFGEAKNLAVRPGEAEWVVAIQQKGRTSVMALQAFQLRAIREIIEAYSEHRNRADPKMLSAEETMNWSRHASEYLIARGLNRQGAERLVKQLSDRHIPVIAGQRAENADRWSPIWPSVLWSALFLGVILFLVGMQHADPATDFSAHWLFSAPLFLLTAFLSGVSLTLLSTSFTHRRWFRANVAKKSFLDFRPGGASDIVEDALIGAEHIAMVEEIRSPRIAASLERVFNDLLHLRDIYGDREAEEENLWRRVVDEVSEIAAAIAETERGLSQISAPALVRRIEELDRQLAQAVEVELVDELMTQRAALREQLEARDGAQQRLEDLGQRLLERASEMEDLVYRHWAGDKEEIDGADLAVLDFALEEEEHHEVAGVGSVALRTGEV